MATQANPMVVQKAAAVKTLEKMLEIKKDDIIRALPKHLRYDNWTRVALTTFANDSKLHECEPISVGIALMEAAQLGLMIEGFRGEAYLIPFFNGKRKQLEAKFMPGYRGLIKLAIQSGRVIQVRANCVYENDYFAYEEGLNATLEHRPTAPSKRGEMVGAYAICELKDTPRDQNPFKFMWKDEIEGIRLRSPNGHNDDGSPKGTWKTDYEEMSKKTPVRALAKYLNLSPELTRVAVMDEYTEAGIVIDADEPGVDAASVKAGNGYANKAEELKTKISEKKEQQTATPESQAQSVSGTSETADPDPMYLKVGDALVVRGTVTKVFKPSEKKKNVGIKMGKDSFSCWHESLFPPLLTSEGKVCIFAYSVNGDYNNIEQVRKIGDIEYDGGVPVMSSDQAAEMSKPQPEPAQGVEGVFQK